MNNMYKLNLKIPGWNGSEILNILAKFASQVPADGNILEIGALFGRTTYVLGHNKPETTSLTTIDIWPTLLMEYFTVHPIHDGRGGIDEMAMIEAAKKPDPARIDSEDFYKLWKLFTSGYNKYTKFK
jgi:hypothetical protein